LYTERLIHRVKDFKRSIDFLETREDIDNQKLAYYGLSLGGFLGAIIPAVEERLQTTIILGGGLGEFGRPEAHQINYVTRVKTPTLMLNGKHDTVYPYETSIKPMFDLLGTPDEHKKLKLYETDHIPPINDSIKEILAWLDRYLGPVE
jgi:cephalosporin-C deacetylase-like acetyl esterase